MFVSTVQQYKTATCVHTPPSSASLPPTLPPSHPSRSSRSSSWAPWTSWKVSYCCRGKIFPWEGTFFRHLDNYLVCPGHREQFDVTGTYGRVMGTSSDLVSDKLGTWGLLRHVRGLAFRKILSCYKWGIPWLPVSFRGDFRKSTKDWPGKMRARGLQVGISSTPVSQWPRWERKNGVGQTEVSLI